MLGLYLINLVPHRIRPSRANPEATVRQTETPFQLAHQQEHVFRGKAVAWKVGVGLARVQLQSQVPLP
jgi:hypothetical protein